MHNKHITQLSDKDILDLGKMITGKSSTRLKKYENSDGFINAEFRVDQNAQMQNILGKTKIYSVNAQFNDYSIDGTINSFYPLNSERYFEKFVTYMINRFGKDYAIDLYNYHKSIIEEINIFSKKFTHTSELAKENPDVASYFSEKAHNMQMDYKKKLAKLKALINENLYGNDKIDDFDILNNI